MQNHSIALVAGQVLQVFGDFFHLRVSQGGRGQEASSTGRTAVGQSGSKTKLSFSM